MDNEKTINKYCIICGEPTRKGQLFCLDCFYDIKDISYNFNHNRSGEDIKEHYFNLKNKMYKIKNEDDLKDNIMYLYAIADEYHLLNGKYLIDRVEADILDILNNFNKYKKNNLNTNDSYLSRLDKIANNNLNDIDFRMKWPKEHQCEDGHYVRSLSEMLIDDWLYTHNYVHAYEKSVFMETDPDAIVLSDFYLPKFNVYIEFWGLEDNDKYLKRKEEKIKLYDENNINRIDLTEKDIKRLNDVLPRLLAKYKK